MTETCTENVQQPVDELREAGELLLEKMDNIGNGMLYDLDILDAREALRKALDQRGQHGGNPQMAETRLEKAQRLVDEGKVKIGYRGAYETGAVVQTERSHYHTTVYTSGKFFCTCNWGQHHSYTDDLCVHALAVQLAMEKEN